MPGTKIRFTKDALANYCENFEGIDLHSDNIEELASQEVPRLEREIRRSGKWYALNTESQNSQNYLCVFNNLKVYRGVRTKTGDILITTAYNYKQDLKTYINAKMTRFPSLDKELALKRD
ncbi:MAG: hypothetical protein PHC66_01325 [Candidatus Nanoarchaeia archaeon]|nr:hypothetical protein [Candidatus Nanoarchaeia archaeon]MDD5239135.1 hypothetical protein [Candidatus Nanoarchaeia archaeon]